jgi:hypothetical protein
MNLSKEIKAISLALLNDPGYYYAWQANIAMTFYDECQRNQVNPSNLHEICNQAAKNFLSNLTYDVRKSLEE